MSSSAALTLVAETKGRVVERIAEAKSFTESQVLGCGEELSALVDTVRDLIADGDREAAATAARSQNISARFVAGMQADMAAQQAAVREVLTLADGIQAATASIERLTQMSHIMALNMRIEAARAGEQGRGFAVIATQMRDLAGTIREASDEVNAAVGGVRAGLPTVMAHSTSMQEHAKRFITEMSTEVASVNAASGASGGKHLPLDSVMALSNAALSHLQFYDPLVKQLDAVIGDIGQCERRLQRVLDGQDDVDADPQDFGADQTQESLGGTPAPGGLILF